MQYINDKTIFIKSAIGKSKTVVKDKKTGEINNTYYKYTSNIPQTVLVYLLEKLMKEEETLDFEHENLSDYINKMMNKLDNNLYLQFEKIDDNINDYNINISLVTSKISDNENTKTVKINKQSKSNTYIITLPKKIFPCLNDNSNKEINLIYRITLFDDLNNLKNSNTLIKII